MFKIKSCNLRLLRHAHERILVSLFGKIGSDQCQHRLVMALGMYWGKISTIWIVVIANSNMNKGCVWIPDKGLCTEYVCHFFKFFSPSFGSQWLSLLLSKVDACKVSCLA